MQTLTVGGLRYDESVLHFRIDKIMGCIGFGKENRSEVSEL